MSGRRTEDKGPGNLAPDQSSVFPFDVLAHEEISATEFDGLAPAFRLLHYTAERLRRRDKLDALTSDWLAEAFEKAVQTYFRAGHAELAKVSKNCDDKTRRQIDALAADAGIVALLRWLKLKAPQQWPAADWLMVCEYIRDLGDERGAVVKAAKHFKISTKTAQRYWAKYQEALESEE